jgi:hypothetical protein
MTRGSILVAATMAALTGCTEHFEPDLTRCKAQVVEVFGPRLGSGLDHQAAKNKSPLAPC